MEMKLKKSKSKKIFKFKNGATIIYQKDKRADYSSVHAGFICGTSKNKMNGLAHFCEHMMFNGTKNRTKDQITEDNSKICYMNASTGLNTMYVKFSRCNRKLDAALEFASDLLLNSNFTKDMVEKERGIIKEEYLKNADKEKHSVVFYHDKIMFDSVDDAKHAVGDTEDIDKISLRALNKYKKDNFYADNFVFSYCGNLSLSRIKKLAKKHFIDKLAQNRNYKIDVFRYELIKKPSMNVVENDDNGVQMMVSFAFNRTQKEIEYDYNPSFLRVFMRSNKHQYYNLLRDNGLVYTAEARAVSFYSKSIFVFALKTSPEKVDDCLKIINQSICDVVKNKISKEEIETIKDNYIDLNDEQVSKKTKADKSFNNVHTYIREGKFEFMPWKKEKKLIKAITPESVNAFAKEIFTKDNKPYVTILGNTNKVKMPSFNKVCSILLKDL